MCCGACQRQVLSPLALSLPKFEGKTIVEQTRHIVEKKCPPTKTWSKPKHFLLTNLDAYPTLELPLITILGLSEHDSHHQIHSLFPSFDLGKSKENPKHPRDFHIQILINEHWAYNHTSLNKRIKKKQKILNKRNLTTDITQLLLSFYGLSVIEWFLTWIYGEFFVWLGIIIGQFSQNQDSQ